MKKKAQVAMESLMVYGIAILIVMLAIGALIYFGVLDLGSYLPDKCNLPGQVKCENYRVSVANMVFEFRNSVGKNIIINNLTFTGDDDWLGRNCAPAAAVSVAVQNGELSTPITLACTGTPTPIVGKKIKGELLLSYRVAGGSTIDNPIRGELQAKVQT